MNEKQKRKILHIKKYNSRKEEKIEMSKGLRLNWG